MKVCVIGGGVVGCSVGLELRNLRLAGERDGVHYLLKHDATGEGHCQSLRGDIASSGSVIG